PASVARGPSLFVNGASTLLYGTDVRDPAPPALVLLPAPSGAAQCLFRPRRLVRKATRVHACPQGNKGACFRQSSCPPAMSSNNVETLLFPIIELACNAYRSHRMRRGTRARAPADLQTGNTHARTPGVKSRWQGACARHRQWPRADRGGGHALLYCSQVPRRASVARR